MKKKNQRLFLVLILTGLLFNLNGGQSASADGAPPPPPAGSDPYPSIGNTFVRMVSERVEISILEDTEYREGEALVYAVFYMQNMGEEEEQMRVRFPMNHYEYRLEYEVENFRDFCGDSFYPSLNDINVQVNGKNLVTEITTQMFIDFQVPFDENGDVQWKEVPCWAYFDVLFPPGEEVIMEVTYTIPGYFPSTDQAWIKFPYVLGTGAGWYDTIGEADIVLKYPYELEVSNEPYCEPEDCVISGKEAILHYEDFEPEGLVDFTVIDPRYWGKVVYERQNASNYPQSGETWGRLGKAFKEVLRSRKFPTFSPYGTRGEEIYYASKEAYQKALQYLPDDYEWHFGYAELVCGSGIDMDICVEEAKIVLEHLSDPEKIEILLNVLDYAQHIFPPEEYENSELEQLVEELLTTPTPAPTATSHFTKVPSRTVTQPSLTVTKAPVASVTPPPEQDSPLVEKNTPAPAADQNDSGSGQRMILLGGAVLLGLIVVGLILRKRNL